MTFHDATELFLRLVAEHLNVASKRDLRLFKDYWEVINTALAPKELLYHGAMERLNDARVALKHHGNLPSQFNIMEFSQLTRSFLAESTLLVFKVSLDRISMADFVASEPARKALQKALAALDSNDIKAGLNACAEAFDELTREYEARTVIGRELD